MTTTMVEKVARAIAFDEGGRIIGPGQSKATREFGWKGEGEHFEKYADAHWKEHIGAAMMAIQAMRVPTENMIDAAVDQTPSIRENWGVDALPIWEAMIDEALKDGSVETGSDGLAGHAFSPNTEEIK